jgi:ferric-dicitrate binding protein FerR (iron transport regulator)
MLVKIAALLFIPLVFASIWFYVSTKRPYQGTDSYITINTPTGSKIKTELPDGTLIWQNSRSTIRYPKNFTKRNRQVILSGEAFFDVSPDKLHPFFVTTATQRIKVTGTRFNVSAYEDEGSISVALVSGNISATRLGTGQEREVPLIPGDFMVCMPGKQEFVRHNVPLEKYVSWIEGKLVFRDDPLGEILKKLARWYNVDIELDDPGNRFKDLPFTMTVKDESFPQIMEYIRHAAPLVIREEKMTQQADGSFSRQKYIIRYRK